MIISILHIDDEQDVLNKVATIVNATQINGHQLKIIHSCGFEEGMLKLRSDSYDLVILDLCVGNASQESDKVGDKIFEQIKYSVFIPVIFFTGLPDYVRHLSSDIVKVAGKLEGYDALFHKIDEIITSGVIKVKKDVDDILREGVRSFFWNFVHENTSVIAELNKDDVSLKYLLLRRLGKVLSSELTRSEIDDPDFKKELSHPMEFYIFPKVKGEYGTGDLIKSKQTQEVFIILTPSCDLVLRPNGKRKADRVLLIHTKKFNSSDDYNAKMDLLKKQAELEKQGKKLSDKEYNQLSNLIGKLKSQMKPGENERYFFLPPTFFLDASFVDFQIKTTVSYEQLKADYEEPFASVDNPVSQAIISAYTRYYSRIGYRDLDVEYAYAKIQ